MALKIFPYRQGSNGAAQLGQALGARVLRRENSTWRPRAGQSNVVVNWGASDCPQFQHTRVLNPSNAVVTAGNKLSFFRAVNDSVLIPIWCTERNIAERWLREGHTVVCRTVLTGHSGNGIIIVSPGEQLPAAPLYTRYQKKTHEYRVHVFKDRNGVARVTDFARKIKDPDREPTNWQVRSHANGFIFSRNNQVLPDEVSAACLEVFNRTNLDFGAVDVIYHQPTGVINVLEINTAPGLEGTTIDTYANAIRSVYND